MNRNEAFKIAQEAIQDGTGDNSGEFHLVSAQELPNGVWLLEVGFIAYYSEEFVRSKAGQEYGLEVSDAGTPSEYITMHCGITADGDFEEFCWANHELEDHPNYRQV